MKHFPRSWFAMVCCMVLGFHGQMTQAQRLDDAASNVVVRWNAMLLEAIRHAYLGPPMVARALATAHTCMYDAWAAYDDKAVGTQITGLRRPQAERTPANKAIAISYAAYRAARDLFPAAADEINHFMRDSLGYDPLNETTNVTSPAGIGNVACSAVLSTRHKDGSNQTGEMSAGGRPYSDYTGYAPVNEVSEDPNDFEKLKDPNRYQPLYYTNPAVRNFYPPFVGAQWFRVISFAGPYTSEFSQVLSHFPLARYGTAEFEAQAEELLKISAELTDEQKMIAEYWMDGPNSELPPGHWCLFAQFVSQRDHHGVDDDVKMFFVLTNALMDAGIAAWDGKRKVDSVRPITAIHYLYRGKRIQGWGGPGNGTVSMDGSEWKPYQPERLPTPPFPEYPSGHSTFSAAGARILQLWTGSDDFGDEVHFAARSSMFEGGIGPTAGITLRWPTFTAAANQAGISRRYGGIHFRAGDLAGRELGSLVAEKVWSKAQAYFNPPLQGQGSRQPSILSK